MYTKEDVTLYIRWSIDQSEFSQREIANKLGVSATTVNRWYHGTRIPDALCLVNLAVILGTIPPRKHTT